ncbi:F-box/FBD/LRR-repeat protein At1g13570-like [Chenopodium quinoa]|uniref:F-box/FBD/LRR-repeat protein At1g13570-like n=1 Tax=Chenopodium quinoa TaxID=63459 RepID=UPI000B7734C9|nr:F-box/FBD/LRR-repeat protein At1g13570-like [Chenopodium quinoa]
MYLYCPTGNSKQLCKESNDIISNLPLEVTEYILEHLPFHHAVRMSILSRYWRYKWVMLPHITLDQKFFEYVLKRFINRISEASQAYSDIISNILLRHIGRIDKFVLFMPSWFPLKADLSQWLQFVSRHGIKEFALVNNNHSLSPKLPSCLYSFETLTQLTLYNCHDLNLPPTFKGFPHLKFMELEVHNKVPLKAGGAPISLLDKQEVFL